MKKFKNRLLIFSIIISLSGCYDPFDLTRNDIISDQIVFDNPSLADAFLFDLYDRAQFHIKSGNGNLNMGLISSYGGESRNYGVSWQIPYTQVIDVDYNESGLQGKVLDYYDYSLIRECNQMITKLPLSNNLTEDFIESRVAEARFIRAHAYFEMAKRFGGIPLITDVIPIQGTYDEIYRERNSEKEIYDFISNEMDDIAEILASLTNSLDDGKGRVELLQFDTESSLGSTRSLAELVRQSSMANLINSASLSRQGSLADFSAQKLGRQQSFGNLSDNSSVDLTHKCDGRFNVHSSIHPPTSCILGKGVDI